MSASEIAQPPDLTALVAERVEFSRVQRERNLWIGLCLAVMLHGAFLIHAGQAIPKDVGDPNGAQDSVSVSLITESDFKNQSEEASKPAPPAPVPSPNPPGPPSESKAEPQKPPQQQPQQEPQPPQEAQPETPPQPQQEPPPPQPPEPKTAALEKPLEQPTPSPPPPQDNAPVEAKKPTEQPAAEKKPEPEPLAELKDAALQAEVTKAEPDLFKLDAPVKTEKVEKKVEEKVEREQRPATQEPREKKVQKQKRDKVAKLDPSLPPNIPDFSGGGGGAAFARPPGITKSGWNDKFAREVINALRQTMPQLREILGRVTVRIFLNENGNVADVKVMVPSKVATLDQSVVFAVRQTSFPFPPAAATVADRTFLVTYIYH